MKAFLDKYDTLIFDMDGVITSEESYWNCAALAVWEYMRGGKINSAECMARLKEIRAEVFFNDELICVLKGKGVNSNWDLGYVTVLMAWICSGRDTVSLDGVLAYAKSLPDNIIEVYDTLSRRCHEAAGYDYRWLLRNGVMWQTMQELFQEWLLGDKLCGHLPMNAGKPGLLYREEPIVDKARLVKLLKELGSKKRLCTGTGRPYVEMIQPLSDWGVTDCFAKDGLCCYDHVRAAEKTLGCNKLTKPHPYMFLKALYGTDFDDGRLLAGEYDKTKIPRTLVIGDAGADILAAQAMGADFCAVLTGINGSAARGYFEKLNADYIIDSVLDLD